MTEALFASGVLTTATRVGFARHYDLSERVLPPEVLSREVDDADAVRELMLRAAGALGVGTEADVRDYFRLVTPPGEAGDRQAGRGWRAGTGRGRRMEGAGVSAGGADHSAARPRHRAALPVRPADLLPAARRAALRRLQYRIEIYTPAAKRQYGYYVWPFLLDGELVGRVDLKADRASDALHVVGAFAEAGEEPSRVAQALAAELRSIVSWLGLADVTVGRNGDLARPLGAALK